MCNKPLRLIGNTRKNGKTINNTTGKDWVGRKFHKKCFKIKKEKELADLIYKTNLQASIEYD